MTDRPTQFDPPPEDLPPRLADELRQLYRPSVVVPGELDRAVLAAARRRLVGRRRWRLTAGWLAAGAAAAAGIALAVILVRHDGGGPAAAIVRTGAPSASPVARGDVDGNGRVDILDAFTLARRVEAGTATEPAWDVNGDGVVDQRDAESVARLAVSVSGGAA